MRAGLNWQERWNTHTVGVETRAETPCYTAINGELDWSAHAYSQ